MINIVLLLVFLTCLGITGAWLAENPGNVTIHWFDYRIDTSFAFLLLCAIFSAFALACLTLLLRRIVAGPRAFARRRDVTKYEKGLMELTYSVAALAAADSKEADIHTRKAEKILGQTPLTLLLSAQIARSQGEEEKTKALLSQMLDHKETEYLAARYLSDAASKQQQLPKALTLAQRANAINPKGIASVLSLHIRLGMWQEALHTIDKSVRKGQLARQRIRRYKGIVYAQQALQLLSDDRDQAALVAARHAFRLLPDFIPCVILYARALAANGYKRKAIKLISRAWSKALHLPLADALRIIIADEPKDKQLKIIRQLAATRPESIDSDMALAQLAVANQEWAVARRALTAALAKSETVHACKLMAEVEKGQMSDYDAAAKWLERSAEALSDPAWICNVCSHAAAQWEAHCPACQEFDSLEWKRRDLTFVG